MADRGNSWIRLLPAELVQTPAQGSHPAPDPVQFMLLVQIACTSTAQLPKRLQKEFTAGLEQWIRNGGSLDAAFGWRAGRGQRHRTARGLAVSAARARAISLVVSVAAENPNAAARAALPILRGDTTPPTPEAAQAIEEVKRLGGTWPDSVSGLRTLIVDVSAKS